MTSPKSLNILISAGPTREPIDDIRFISNYSTGLLGFELAKEALRRQHNIILIAGPVHLETPKKVKRIDVITASDMQKEINRHFEWCNCLIMSAAVSDYRPKRKIPGKLKKRKSQISLELIKNPDILKTLGKKKKDKILVGFSLDVEETIENAKTKLKDKNLDLIVANRMSSGNIPFGRNKISVSIIDKSLKIIRFKDIYKKRLAHKLLDIIERLCYT